MSYQPELYINFEVYEDGVAYLGVADLELPSIDLITQTFSGAGIGGNIEVVATAMFETMTLSINFHSVTDAAKTLMEHRQHTLDIRVCEQYWDTVDSEFYQWPDKYILVVVPKSTSPGKVAPASLADVSGEYSVRRYEAYRNGNELWKIDPYNYIYNVNGTDYAADVRSALGRS